MTGRWWQANPIPPDVWAPLNLTAYAFAAAYCVHRAHPAGAWAGWTVLAVWWGICWAVGCAGLIAAWWRRRRLKGTP